MENVRIGGVCGGPREKDKLAFKPRAQLMAGWERLAGFGSGLPKAFSEGLGILEGLRQRLGQKGVLAACAALDAASAWLLRLRLGIWDAMGDAGGEPGLRALIWSWAWRAAAGGAGAGSAAWEHCSGVEHRLRRRLDALGPEGFAAWALRSLARPRAQGTGSDPRWIWHARSRGWLCAGSGLDAALSAALQAAASDGGGLAQGYFLGSGFDARATARALDDGLRRGRRGSGAAVSRIWGQCGAEDSDAAG